MLRSNIKNLEYYHVFKDIETFKRRCHDFYVLFPLWLVEEGLYNEAVIWRLSKKPIKDIIFRIEDRRYIQRWVRDFSEIFKYPSPEITFFRGGFKEYDKVIIKNKKFFGKSIYLGASQRRVPQYGGIYDINLYEDEKDILKGYTFRPFYKTVNPNIFKPLENVKQKIDILWPANWGQIKYKGFDFFLKQVSNSKFLKSLVIVNVGNNSEVGKKLCLKYGLKNVYCIGYKTREEINILLNSSKFGLNCSNFRDGCPRVSTEILCSGTPLLLRNTVRLLNYYKKNYVLEFGNNLETVLKNSLENYNEIKKCLLKKGLKDLSFKKICDMNLKEWGE